MNDYVLDYIYDNDLFEKAKTIDIEIYEQVLRKTAEQIKEVKLSFEKTENTIIEIKGIVTKEEWYNWKTHKNNVEIKN